MCVRSLGGVHNRCKHGSQVSWKCHWVEINLVEKYGAQRLRSHDALLRHCQICMKHDNRILSLVYVKELNLQLFYEMTDVVIGSMSVTFDAIDSAIGRRGVQNDCAARLSSNGTC